MSKADPVNVIAVIMDRNENGSYPVGTKHGIIKGLYDPAKM